MTEPRRANRNRWKKQVLDHLEGFPRQYLALENAMGAFGEDFDLQPFKAAFDTQNDMDAYNQVQAVERALGRVQNYVAELAKSGVKLAALSTLEGDEGQAVRAFEALKDAQVIDGSVCRRLKRAQSWRIAIEHEYVAVPAGDVHRAARLIHQGSGEFLRSYAEWIKQYL